MKLIKWLFTLGLIVLFSIIGTAYLTLQNNIQLPGGAAEYRYSIAEGLGSSQVANDLAAQKIIVHSAVMKIYLRITQKARALKAGEYQLTNNMNMLDMLKLFEQGLSIQHQFTIIEGWNIRELLAALRSKTEIKQTLPAGVPDDLMERLGEPNLHPEGAFLPETYSFSSGTTDIQFLRRARSHMQDYLQQAWEQRSEKSVVKTPYEALILASIVEKETGAAHERPLISGVFTNRLNIGMRLQTDPTVIYGMGEAYDGDIRFRDLRKPTPYNTYTIYGLPPTPIAMPGKHAIDAALNPESTKALYFVSRNDGTHIFSSTLKAHESAVDKYQRNR